MRALLLVLGVACSAPATAQQYPQRAVRAAGIKSE
jgi:hypothetical protein